VEVNGKTTPRKQLIYLAHCYSHENEAVREQRARYAARIAGLMIAQGFAVISPIAHGHAIAKEADIPIGWDYWQEEDLAILERCDQVGVILIDGNDESIGLGEELKRAEALGLKVFYVTLIHGKLFYIHKGSPMWEILEQPKSIKESSQ
jgi:hypothetical protein